MKRFRAFGLHRTHSSSSPHPPTGGKTPQHRLGKPHHTAWGQGNQMPDAGIRIVTLDKPVERFPAHKIEKLRQHESSRIHAEKDDIFFKCVTSLFLLQHPHIQRFAPIAPLCEPVPV
jgi:hypothetical protein